MNPTLMTTLKTAIAASIVRPNHWPIIVRLTTESALCPRARVSVTQIASAANVCVRLIAQTTAPSASGTAVAIARLPRRSISWPMPIAPAEPTISGSVMRPSPCVRPGSVPTMAAAATSTMYQP